MALRKILRSPGLTGPFVLLCRVLNLPTLVLYTRKKNYPKSFRSHVLLTYMHHVDVIRGISLQFRVAFWRFSWTSVSCICNIVIRNSVSVVCKLYLQDVEATRARLMKMLVWHGQTNETVRSHCDYLGREDSSFLDF